jgi:hypothetical protein
MLMTIGETKLVIAETDREIVAINAANGKQAWSTPFGGQGPGAYNAPTPIVDGQTLIYSGGQRGTHAVKIEKASNAFAGKEVWNNTQTAVQFDSPVAKDGLVYGLTQSNELFCMDEQTGKTAWSASIGSAGQGGPGRPGGGGGRPGGRRGGGGRGGYGAIVDAQSVLIVLTPKSELVVVQPGEKAYAEVARIKVAESPTYAYPVLSGKRIFIKDQDSVTLLAVE